MPTKPASSASPSSEASSRARADAWDGLAEQLSCVADLARKAGAPEEFYPELLRRAVEALAAEGGAVWTPRAEGPWRRLCVIDPPDHVDCEESRSARQDLLNRVVAERTIQTFAPRSQQAGQPGANPTPYALVIAPVASPQHEQPQPPAALVEISLRSGAGPAVHQGAEQFLAALVDVAAEFHAYSKLGRLGELCRRQERLLALGDRVHRSLDLKQTAAAVANESRGVIGCDRVSVLVPRGRRCRVLAVSGVDRPDRRSRTLRDLERLAAMSVKLQDPLCLSDDQTDTLPQASDALHAYADLSGARQVAVVPMTVTAQEEEAPPEIVGVLVAESFDGQTQAAPRDLVTEAALVCAPALRHAVQVDAVPLYGLLRAARGWKRPSFLAKVVLAVAMLAGGVAALMLVPAELRVEARGELQPVVRRNVFAPGEGIVQRLLVHHGQQVKQGELLAELRDPQLELEIKRVDGERSTARKQLEAVRATRTSIDPRSGEAAESYRLSAEEQQIKQRIDALQQEKALLARQRDALRILSPLDGMVLNWRLDETLHGRPIERGQVLLTVAATHGDWRVELSLPDDRIGHLVQTQRDTSRPIAVEYRLGSQEEGFETGQVEWIASRAESPDTHAAPGAMRTIAVHVTPDKPIDPTAPTGDIRPGASVRARVLCGQRSLGYVWMHDLLNAARVWWEF